jgi:two-component system nitrogen regulation response regulator NtrX
LPEQLVESELFGAARGAHSSAFTDIPGKISAAHRGTLLLDEIGELPLYVQAKFLQFLEESYFYPLGSKTKVHPDVRIVAASNADFDEMINEGRFRSDLFFRLNVFSIHMPPLSERRDDIPNLVKFFVEKHAGVLKIPRLEIKNETINVIMGYSFPGNIRQLENMCQQAIIRAYKCNDAELKLEYFAHQRNLSRTGRAEEQRPVETPTFHTERVRWEKAYLSDQLQSNNWNISKTAESIGLSRSHMNNLVKHYCLRKGKDV